MAKQWSISALFCLLLAGLSSLLNFHERLALPQLASLWIGYLYVMLIHLAPAIIYLLLFKITPRFRDRILLSFLPTAGWWFSELLMRLRWHTLAEAVWLVVSPFFFFQLALILAALGIVHVLVLVLNKQKPRFLSGLAYATLVLATALSAPASIEPFLIGYQSTFQSNLLPRPQDLPGRLNMTNTDSQSQNPPNIVFILSDDHRHDFTGYMGHPFIETPNIDELASEGIIFDRAYVSTSLCSPSRATYLTGVSPYKHGVWNNFTPWSEENRTFFEYLKAVGYSTAFIGKWHMPGNTLPNIAGLDHFISFTNIGGQGTYEWNPMIVNGTETPSRTRYIATELTDYAIEWLEQQTSPFVLYLSHKSVHANFQPDTPDIGIYKRQQVNLPEGAHVWSAHTKNQYVHLNNAPLDESIRRYGEAIHSLDREIGRLLASLRSMNLADNTIVIYTSDNGYQWGEHELIDKRWAYETSIRVPFVVRLPENRYGATINSSLVANLDVAPTLLDAAGVRVPGYMEGGSLLRLLSDEKKNWRETFFYSYFFEPPYPTPTSFALITERYKLIETNWRGYELYDLWNDPEEKNNLANDTAFTQTHHKLVKLLTVEKERSSISSH
ncbi:MAG TPA: acetylglucosamine-6-sulfatase [Gammaproteobacteria bacterium]|nr:acetylglucosamine-6-sulfatase [Gammaproteobacteria bacterium]